MGFVLDDGWDNCTPVARSGNAAFGVYCRCGIWVARNLTDGFVPGEIATAYGSPELTRKLVDVGLWEAVEGGYLAVDYLTLNKTADKVREVRKAEAERKARWRENAKKAQQRAGKPSPRGTRRGTPTGQDAGQDAGLTSPLSSSPKGEERGSAPASPGGAPPPTTRASPPATNGAMPDLDRRAQLAAQARAAVKKRRPIRARDGLDLPPDKAQQALDALDAAVAALDPPAPSTSEDPE